MWQSLDFDCSFVCTLQVGGSPYDAQLWKRVEYHQLPVNVSVGQIILCYYMDLLVATINGTVNQDHGLSLL